MAVHGTTDRTELPYKTDHSNLKIPIELNKRNPL